MTTLKEYSGPLFTSGPLPEVVRVEPKPPEGPAPPTPGMTLAATRWLVRRWLERGPPRRETFDNRSEAVDRALRYRKGGWSVELVQELIWQ